MNTMRAASQVRCVAAKPASALRSAVPVVAPLRRSRYVQVRAQDGVQQKEKIENVEAGNISPNKAEIRADLGSAWTDPSQVQAFDGPAPETINGRLAMIGVVTGLLWEAFAGIGLKEQCADHPLIILAWFVIISLASYVPISRGYTRKEAFANGPWTPKAENWNGRLAMMGFTAMIITEAITGQNTLEFWGLAHKVASTAL